ncbi:MAG: sigma-70 family RNA polymerase sigma factor [Candidatus Aminicenantes bacterium]|nr:sigma-70 family RNA polymerase sigma factor [Candidatus Aminicenantes bacterium]
MDKSFTIDDMELKKLIKTQQFIEEMSKSIEHIIWKNFPQISREEREDITQEVKLKIWKMASRGKKIKNLRSYLWKVVYTTALDIINKRMNTVPFDAVMKADNTNPFSQLNIASSEALIEKKELRIIITKALNSLPQNRRIVIKLYLTGMNLHEIADFLNWNKSKVNHLYYRGLGDLKEKLKELKK